MIEIEKRDAEMGRNGDGEKGRRWEVRRWGDEEIIKKEAGTRRTEG